MLSIHSAAEIRLAALGTDLAAIADYSGLHLRRSSAHWPDQALRDPRWLLATLQLDHLLENGFVLREGAGWRLPSDHLDAALSAGFTMPLLWSGWSPHRLRITAGVLDGQLAIDAAFRAGGRHVILRRAGRFVQRSACPEQTWLLNRNTALLLDTVATLAASPPRTSSDRARAIAWLREAGEEVGAELGGCLASGTPVHREVVPSHAEDRWHIESEGLSYTDFLRLSPTLLEAAVAGQYQHRGFRAALLPHGNGFGVAVLARMKRTAELAFVDAGSSPRTLDDIMAAESSVRANLPADHLRSVLFSRLELETGVKAPLQRRGIEVIDGRLFAERLRSWGVNGDIARVWQQYRCRTFADSKRMLLEVT